MSGTSTLCAWPAGADTDGCCAAPTATGPVVPAAISNAPGLPAIAYRIGNFTSFRRAMLDQVPEPDLLLSDVSTILTADAAADAVTLQVDDYTAFPASAPFRVKIGDEYVLVVSGAGTKIWTVVRGSDGSVAADHVVNDPVLLDPVNPFAAWREGADGDYLTMLVELWAYLADVLTFYQERIANEAFLGTATQRDSLLRLAELVDSEPGPGAGASGLVSLTVANGQVATVPAGLRVASKAAPGKPAATFETATAITARGDHNAMKVLPSGFVNQFATSTDTVRLVALVGTDNALRIGDFVVAVCNERAGNKELARAFRLQSVSTDREANTTTIGWTEAPGIQYDQSLKPVSLYALRVTTGVFGNNAPAHKSLPPSLTTPLTQTSPPVNPPFPVPPPYQADWDTGPGSFVPGGTTLDLDGIYDSIQASPEIPGWAVVMAGDPPTGEIDTPGPSNAGAKTLLFHVTSARPVSRVDFTLNARVTRLTVGSKEAVPANTFPMRTTVVAAGTTALPLRLLPLPVTGTAITLAGSFDQLQPGQTVVVQGPSATDGTVVARSHVLNGPPAVTGMGTTVVNLTTPLTTAYQASGTVVLGNVVVATQGETVRDELLGNGSATPFQSFMLKKTPLTFLPSSDPSGLTAVQDTLIVTVNAVRWSEMPNLLSSGPDATVFLARTDDQQRTTVSFGDGRNGAMPPSGVGNIRARYRRGLGSSGNLPAGAVRQMIDSAPGLQRVTNPLPTTGGADPSGIDQIRQTTPASLTSFGRAVSADDYAVLALQFPGIAKATSNWVVRGQDGKPVPIPYMQLTVALNDGAPVAGSVTANNLRAFIDSHRDTNVPLRILDFTPVFIDVELTVDILDQYPRQATLTRVTAALNPGVNPDGSAGYFSFQNAAPGKSVHLSTVYAVAQAIEGVRDVLITRLRPAATVPGRPEAVFDDIFVRPTEIVEIGNDPNDPSKGRVLVTHGSGGFSDS